MRWLTLIAAGITATTVGGIGALVYWKRDLAAGMTLNEWGDFLAGLSAPIALLWLVIGYFQQGKELQLNTEALKAQQEELRRQVAETAALARNAERQAAASETMTELSLADHEQRIARLLQESQPRFVFPGSGSSGPDGIVSTVENHGATAKNVEIRNSNSFAISISPDYHWPPARDGKLHIRDNSAIEYPFFFVIAYTDEAGNANEREFRCTAPHRIEEVLRDV